MWTLDRLHGPPGLFKPVCGRRGVVKYPIPPLFFRWGWVRLRRSPRHGAGPIDILNQHDFVAFFVIQ
jgi:hypothetical protein